MGRVIKFFRFLRAFFPINLFFAQIKYNLFFLFFWFFLFGIINNFIGSSFGLPYLFLSPEYLGQTNAVSFLLLGIGLGGFIMAFHIYSYLQLGPKYPFIATLARPFYKFLINNSILPLLFVVNLSYCIFQFQQGQEYVQIAQIIFDILALVLGTIFFLLLALLYFLPTNKDFFKITGKKKEKEYKKSKDSNIHATFHRKEAWYTAFLGANNNYTFRYFYIGSRFKIKQSRSTAHYDMRVLNKVFSQNQINASVFEVLLVISFILLGFFRNYAIFQVPASVSIFLILTIFIMLLSAIFSWFRSWTYPIILLLFLLVNYLSVNTHFFQFKSYAYGLSYEQEDLVNYNKSSIKNMVYSDSIIQQDYEKYVQTLENWKNNTGMNKPKLVIVNTSGGGLRSAMWTFYVLQKLDSLTNNQFMNRVQMITGASGGMIGAAYYRDIELKEKRGEISSRTKEQYLKNIGKDLLNRLAFAFSTSDLFFRFQRVEINGHSYNRDRGYAFEQELLDNLNGALGHTLGFYKGPERAGIIPTMILSPTIINDGRRLLVCAQHLGFLQSLSKLDDRIGLHPQLENIEYLRYFKSNNPEEILFTSVLRMNATFPYIMPMVSMPTQPAMFIMDAGIRDNYGSKLTIRYLITIRKWIRENTSGVIILKIRDKKKTFTDDNKKSYRNIGLVERLFLPFGNMYGNYPRVQDFNQDEMFTAMFRSIDYPMNIVYLNLRETNRDKISLSWHLTSKEKKHIKKAFYSKDNQKAVQHLLNLLKIKGKQENE